MGGSRGRQSHSGLPAPPNALIGRERELHDLLQLLQTADVRLVTITGPAGAGKTRLALAVAAQSAQRAVDGVWFVDLAPIHDPRQVLAAIGRATGVREQRGELAQARLQRHIGQRHVLVLLDNFEQVLAAAPAVADLLAACPHLAVLATSRAPLHLRWERVFRVQPLAIPTSFGAAFAELAAIPSVALFVDRARAVDPAFRLTRVNAPQVAEICARLDGLPLAIELAAARTDAYPPAEVLARLRRRPDLLRGGAADLPARQQSLEAAFDWGYDLLDRSDQALFRALGVFVGGFSPHAALAVAGADDLTNLVRHSLVRRDASDEPRFRMLETVRGYALERLERSGERQSVQQKHAQFMLDLAERAAPELVGARQAFWLDSLEREHGNLAAALRWALEADDLETGLRMARALWRFWWLHGYLSEGMDFLNSVLAAARASPGGHEALRAPVLNGAGVLAHIRGEYERAFQLLTESLDCSRSLGSRDGVAAALHNLAALARERGDRSQAQEAYEASLALERELGNTWGIATSLINLGALAADGGDTPRAEALLQEGLGLMRAIGDTRGVASALHNLASAAGDPGDWRRAADLHEQSLALWRQLGDRWGMAAAQLELARVRERSGEWQRAAGVFERSLGLFGELGMRAGLAACLEGLAAVCCDAARFVEAARLLGAADTLRSQMGVPLPRRDAEDLTRTIARARRGCASTSGFAAAWRAGQGQQPEPLAAEALRMLGALASGGSNAHTRSVLSRRERQVVELVAAGLTNRQIAERLVISERTADRHVSNILGKLGVSTRAQVAAWVAGQQMGTANGPYHP